MTHPPLLDLAGLDALNDPLIIDCRRGPGGPEVGEQAYAAGHIPGARHLDLDRDLSAPLAPAGPLGPVGGRHPLPDPMVFGALLRRLGLSRDRAVVAYDDAGGCYAARLWWMLRWLGHERSHVLDGGLGAWTGAGRALEVGQPAPADSGDWAPAPDPGRLLDFAAVSALPAGAVLVDCRSPERFRGEQEPLDPIGGHIPGAISCFWKDLLDERGRLVGVPALPPGELVLYCGSGVTACVVALALEQAGRPYRLYPGSWSDWLARGGAVETGEGM